MYSSTFDLHADLLKVMAHPRRLEIIHLLRDQELCVSQIFAMLDLPQANISQHLMILRKAGIVTTTRRGKQVVYHLSDPKIIEASDIIREFILARESDPNLKTQLLTDVKDLVPFVQDPVCHMRLSPKTAAQKITHQHHHYYFCASGCAKKFEEAPGKYV
jgi:DNA-binding transcriptional ArsR family regulator/YHS domain-containing protein